jgi:Protein of unknown function (DUF3237)
LTPNRRDLAALALGAAATPALAQTAKGPAAPPLEHVFDATITLGTPVEMGTQDGARQRFVPITGGTVSGPKLTGTILSGGGDRQSIRADGLTQIHATYLIRAADGTVIGIDNAGVRVASAAIIARLTAGEDLDPALYYFRTAPRFDVIDGPHGWLKRSIFVAQGVRHPANVTLRVWCVG